MQTRYSSLVTIKKSAMQKSERVVQNANANLNSALMALELSNNELNNIDFPKNGFMANYLASRTLVSSSRHLIKRNQEWVEFARKEVAVAKEGLKLAMVEYEEFKYLELEEIKIIIKKQKLAESKELDEVALMTYSKEKNIEVKI